MINVFFPDIKSFSFMLRRSSIGGHKNKKRFSNYRTFFLYFSASILESCSLHTNQLAVSSSPALHESINLGCSSFRPLLFDFRAERVDLAWLTMYDVHIP